MLFSLFILCFLFFLCFPVLGNRQISVARPPRPQCPTPLKANEDIFKFARSCGYAMDQLEAPTVDGYILGLHRVQRLDLQAATGVAVLVHGLLDTSDSWFLNGRDSLGFTLADAGMIVYACNVRGNKYSKRHRNQEIENSPKFWAFDYSQHGLKDIPACVEKAKALSGADVKVTLIAHSQGGAATLIAASTPSLRLSDSVSSLQLLSPVTFLNSQKSEAFSMLGKFHTDYVLRKLKPRPLVPMTNFMSKLLGRVCQRLSTGCSLGASLLFGPSGLISKPTADEVSLYANHWPDETSTLNMALWLKNVREKKFANAAGQEFSRTFNTINIPTSFYFGTNDFLAQPADTERLLALFPPSSPRQLVSGFSHMDFVWAREAKPMVYDKIVNALALKPQVAARSAGIPTASDEGSLVELNSAQNNFAIESPQVQQKTGVHVRVEVQI